MVNEFRLGEVRVEGNRWFSDRTVSAPIHFQHGDTIDSRQLLAQLDSANANPFRRVDLLYQPSSQPGFTDLVLKTQDRFPVNFYAGFDNSGTAVTSRSRTNIGATWGNALWHDQQLAYQFSASNDFNTYLGHTLSWTMPLRAHDSLSIFGNFQKSVPNIGESFGYIGKNGQASIRYNLGLHRTSRFVETLQVGYDFKTTNNNLDYGGTQVSRNTTEIDRFPLAYAANLTDKLGSSAFTTAIVFSPGGLSPNNNNGAFQPGYAQSGIPGATSHYYYWRSDFTRLTRLPASAVWAFRLLGQTSTANLLYTEKLTAGGPDLLRGYDPNSVLGDKGIVMSNELRTRPYATLPEHALGQWQFIGFWDYAHLRAENKFPGQVNRLSASSIGPGVRFNLRSNLTARFNYGRQLIHLPNAGPRSHVATIALTMVY